MNLKAIIDSEISVLKSKLEINELNKEKKKEFMNRMIEVYDDYTVLNTHYMNINEALKIMRDIRKTQKEYDSNSITNAMNSVVSFMFPNEDYKFKFSAKTRGQYTYTKLAYANEDFEDALITMVNGFSMQKSIAIVALCVIISLSNITPFIILDECLNNNDDINGEKIAEVLSILSKLGLNLVIIEQRADIMDKIEHTVYTFEKLNGVSRLLSMQKHNIEEVTS